MSRPRRLGSDEVVLVGDDVDDLVVMSTLLFRLLSLTAACAVDSPDVPSSVRNLARSVVALDEFKHLASSVDGPGLGAWLLEVV